MEYIKWQLKKHPRQRCALVFQVYHNHFEVRTDACEVCIFPNFLTRCGRLSESVEKINQVDLHYKEVYKTTWAKSLVVQMTITHCLKFGVHDGRIYYDPDTQSYKGTITATFWTVQPEGTTGQSYVFNIELKEGFIATIDFAYGGVIYTLEETDIFDCMTPHFKYTPIAAQDICLNSTISLEIET